VRCWCQQLGTLLTFWLAEEHKAVLLDKYADLEKAGKLDTYLAKRRKKNATAERKHMPSRRVDRDDE